METVTATMRFAVSEFYFGHVFSGVGEAVQESPGSQRGGQNFSLRRRRKITSAETLNGLLRWSAIKLNHHIAIGLPVVETRRFHHMEGVLKLRF
jgi:hypothetical protein